jgi:hypothetical protein
MIGESSTITIRVAVRLCLKEVKVREMAKSVTNEFRIK